MNRYSFDYDPDDNDEFIQQCNTYGAYKGMHKLDIVLDILDHMDCRVDDREEMEQARLEARAIIYEAIQWIEMTTDENGLDDYEPSTEDVLDREGRDE